MRLVKVGLVSHKYEGSVKETRAKSARLIELCAKQGAKIIALQELHESFYFCQSQNVENFRFSDALNEESQTVKYWQELSAKHEVVLITSLFERVLPGLCHNTSLVFDKGSLAGRYRKMHIPDDPNFYEKFYFAPGDLGFAPINTSEGRLGVLICWDQWFFEASRIMALKGAQLLFFPTAIGWLRGDESDGPEICAAQLQSWKIIMRAQAIANGLPVIAINRVGYEDAALSGETSINQSCATPNAKSSAKGRGIEFWGHSFISNAQGLLLYEQDEKEAAAVVDIDLEESAQIRQWWPFLRDRRIDAYEDLLKRSC